MIHSGSSANSPKSYKSMKGSFDAGSDHNEGKSFGFRYKIIDNSSGNQQKDSHEIGIQNYSQIKEDESSSHS